MLEREGRVPRDSAGATLETVDGWAARCRRWGQWLDLKAIAGAQCARRMDWQDAPRCDIHPDNALARPSDHPQRTSALTILRLDAIVLDVRHQELRLRVREELR